MFWYHNPCSPWQEPSTKREREGDLCCSLARGHHPPTNPQRPLKLWEHLTYSIKSCVKVPLTSRCHRFTSHTALCSPSVLQTCSAKPRFRVLNRSYSPCFTGEIQLFLPGQGEKTSILRPAAAGHSATSQNHRITE